MKKSKSHLSTNLFSIIQGLLLTTFLFFLLPQVISAEELPDYLQDRGRGIPTSMFGTYIEKGDLLFYPFYEFYYDTNAEYSPDEFGYDEKKDYAGKSVGHEALIYLGYGITEWLSIEMEAAIIKDRFEKADNDTSNMPDKIEESGLGDVEGQVRWRWFEEKDIRPEFFSFVEVVTPTQKDDNVLIGTSDWEIKVGAGIIKGFGFGTLLLRASYEYTMEDDAFEPGEYAFSYLKRINDTFRIFLGVEGNMDEVSAIPELQVFLTPDVYLKLNGGFGLTSKATDFAPEVGLMMRF